MGVPSVVSQTSCYKLLFSRNRSPNNSSRRFIGGTKIEKKFNRDKEKGY